MLFMGIFFWTLKVTVPKKKIKNNQLSKKKKGFIVKQRPQTKAMVLSEKISFRQDLWVMNMIQFNVESQDQCFESGLDILFWFFFFF